MASALSKILDARDQRRKHEVATQLFRSMGWGPTPNSTTSAYGGWTSGDPVGLARDPRVFTDAALAPVAPIPPATINSPQPGAPRPGPRRWEFYPAWNLPTPPGSEGIRLAPFSTLRMFSTASAIIRACIDKRVEEIVGLEWNIVPTADKAIEMTDKATRDDFNQRREKVMRFFSKPDPDYDTFHTWLKAVLEDVFVTDALSIYLAQRRDGDPHGGLLGSSLAGLMLIDGATIRPMIDVWGGRPQPPNVAYQQYIWGVPRVDFLDALTQDEQDQEFDPAAKVADLLSDQLLYLPYNKRTNSPYGLSHVEKCLLPGQIDMNKAMYVSKYYTDGNTPSSWVTVGNVDTPQQVRQWQDTLDAMIGDIGARHQVFVLPHGSSAVETKPNLLRDDYDSTNREIIFAVFALTAMEMGFLPGGKSGGLTGGSGMASSHDTNKIRTASIPLCMFLKRNVFDLVIQQIAGQDDMQFQWPDLLAIDDEEQQMNEDVAFVGAGIRTRDEIRRDRGYLPFDLPLTSEPTVTTTSTGVTSLAGNPSGSTVTDTSPLAEQQHQDEMEMAQASRPVVTPGTPGAKPGAKPTSGQSAGGAKPAAKPASNAQASKQLSELNALYNYARHGRPLEKFKVTYLPASLVKLIGDNLNATGTGLTFEEVRDELKRSSDSTYLSFANAVSRTVRGVRDGTISKDAGRERITSAAQVSEKYISVDEIHSIADALVNSENTAQVFEQLKRYYAALRPQRDVTYVASTVEKAT